MRGVIFEIIISIMGLIEFIRHEVKKSMFGGLVELFQLGPEDCLSLLGPED